MSNRIFKYPIPITDKFCMQLPSLATVLCVQTDLKTDTACIWAIVCPENEPEERSFELFGTGQEVPTDMGVQRKYIGTFQCDNGAFVGHLFERI